MEYAVHGQNTCVSQVEILLSGLWDPSSGNLFAEEGDQQRFWKITRKFVEQMAAVSGSKVKAVGPSVQQFYMQRMLYDVLSSLAGSTKPFVN